MTDATPPRAQRKARLAERFWRGPDAVAQANGWQIRKAGWGAREYRDERFDRLTPHDDETAAHRFDEAATHRPDESAVPSDVERFEGVAPCDDQRFGQVSDRGDDRTTRPMPYLPRIHDGVGWGRASGGEGHPRHHPRIPRAAGLLAGMGVAWRWRAEAGLAGVAAAGAYEFGLIAVAVLVLLAAVLPPTRRAVARLVVRHRFQGLCLRTSMRTQKGRLPLVMNVTSTRDCVLLLLWCRSGMSVELFEDYIPEIRVACFATEVLIFPHYRWPHLVTMELRRA